MKKQTRKNVFETNSSSVHTITISRHAYNRTAVPNTLMFKLGEFGWKVAKLDTPEEKAEYLYTAINGLDNMNRLVERIKCACASIECDAVFEESVTESPFDFYIDHSECLSYFIEKVFESDESILRYLFGDGCVYTYNDNMNTDDLYFANEIKSANENDYIVIRKGN